LAKNKKPIQSNSAGGLRGLYEKLRNDAPEAAIGTAAFTAMIFLVTAGTNISSSEGKMILFGIGGMCGLVGVFGYALAIWRARARR
jgi:hypothetical protein